VERFFWRVWGGSLHYMGQLERGSGGVANPFGMDIAIRGVLGRKMHNIGRTYED